MAALVSPGLVLADVGCDHGYIPIYLIQKGQIPRAIAMDINQGPLLRAREHIREWGLEDYIETRLSDGVEALKPGEAQCLVIAGMGGPLMEKILTQGENVVKDMKELILQPQSEISHFRRFLAENGYAVHQRGYGGGRRKILSYDESGSRRDAVYKKSRISLRKRASGNPAPGVKRIPGKRGPGDKRASGKTFRVDTPSAKKRSKELIAEIKDREEALAYYEV